MRLPVTLEECSYTLAFFAIYATHMFWSPSERATGSYRSSRKPIPTINDHDIYMDFSIQSRTWVKTLNVTMDEGTMKAQSSEGSRTELHSKSLMIDPGDYI